MTTPIKHEEIRELLGAYAVHALDGDELAVVETHLRNCEECSTEVDQFHEVAGLLGTDSSLPPDEIWQAISTKLNTTPPIARVSRLSPNAHKGMSSSWLAVAAALLIAVISTAMWTLGSFDKSDNFQLESVAKNASNTAGSRTVTLQSTDNTVAANAVLLPDGTGYLIDANLPSLANGRTYQLWAIVNDVPISIGVLGSSPKTTAFAVGTGVTSLAISEEPSTGSTSPTSSPKAVGTI